MARTVTLPREVERVLARHRQKVGARHAVRTADALVRMVDDLGFCFAFTGESAYPVPAAFDHLDTRSDGRKWEWMWGWKDELAANKRLYYGKLLVKKPTFVSMKMLPIFYATFGRAGDADDHLEDVRAGRLSEIAHRIIDFLAVKEAVRALDDGEHGIGRLGPGRWRPDLGDEREPEEPRQAIACAHAPRPASAG